MKRTKLLALGLALILTSCSATKKTSEISSQNNFGALTSLVLTSAPKNALDIAALRSPLEKGWLLKTIKFGPRKVGLRPAPPPPKPTLAVNREARINPDRHELKQCLSLHFNREIQLGI